MGRRPRSPAPEPGEEVTLPVGLDDSPPDLDDALGDDANATSDIEYSYPCYSPTSPDAHDDKDDGAGAAEVVEVEMPTEPEAPIHGSEQPDVSETIQGCKMTTGQVVTSSDDDSDPRSKEEAPRRNKEGSGRLISRRAL
ncbi:hypothetical protein CYMTET_20436 [Cymbomonas tetramitiformis]|uniref:Uncharacterized protein n=1 Tax=Cymbomonas tetramitiformis TaxID=36881 RepID=A0AAE0L3X0_9CHLO|nr:hypothetical protein CYMTET_20436 [Cymbomonas tetramitiformis]